MEFPTKSVLRKSGIAFSIVFSFVFSIIPLLFHNIFKVGPVYFSLIILSISIISPYSLRIPYILWISLGEKLGKINSKVILSLFFYLLITPFAILKSMLGLNDFYLKKDKRRKTSIVFNSETNSNFKDQY